MKERHIRELEKYKEEQRKIEIGKKQIQNLKQKVLVR